MKKQLAFILSHLLETNNIDTKELSKKIEVVRGHLNDIKNGQDVEVSLSVLTKIAAHFDVTLDYLVYGMPMVKDLDKPQGINWQPITQLSARQGMYAIFTSINRAFAINSYKLVATEWEAQYLANHYTHFIEIVPPEE